MRIPWTLISVDKEKLLIFLLLLKVQAWRVCGQEWGSVYWPSVPRGWYTFFFLGYRILASSFTDRRLFWAYSFMEEGPISMSLFLSPLLSLFPCFHKNADQWQSSCVLYFALPPMKFVQLYSYLEVALAWSDMTGSATPDIEANSCLSLKISIFLSSRWKRTAGEKLG